MADSRLEIVLAAKDLTGQVFATVGSRAQALASRMVSLQGAVLGLAGVGGIGAVATGFLSTARAFERYETQLTTITGSSKAARASMDWIVEFAKKTPYELDQVTAAFTKLQAYGLDGTRWMGTLGDTASAMGKGLDQAVEMFADAVTGEFERLKEFGVKASSEGDRVTFRWSQNGQDMQATAEKTAEGISSALGRIFSRFTGGMEAQAQTFDGIMSNIGDTWASIQREVMNAGVFEAVKDQLADINEAAGAWLETNRAMIRQQVPEYLDAITGRLKDLGETMRDLSSIPSPAWWVAGGALLGGRTAGIKGAVVGAGIGLGVAGYRVAEAVQATTERQIQTLQSLITSARAVGSAPLIEKYERQLAELIARTRSEAAFRGMEMSSYGGASMYGFPMRESAAIAGGQSAGNSGRNGARMEDVDRELDAYFGKIFDRYDAATREAKQLNADYWRALAEVQGAYAVDPELARWEGGQGQKDYARRLIEDGEKAMGSMKTMADRTSYGMQSAFAEFFDATSEGFLSLESLAQNVGASILGALTHAMAAFVVGEVGGGGLLGAIFPSAHGNVFADGNLVPFARGGIVSRPTVFPFARGVGLMGEAGPEAIMPLTRTPSGDLGVRSAGGGGATNVLIQAADAKSFEDMIKRNPGALIKTINRAIAYNGSTRSIIKGTTR